MTAIRWTVGVVLLLLACCLLGLAMLAGADWVGTSNAAALTCACLLGLLSIGLAHVGAALIPDPQ